MFGIVLGGITDNIQQQQYNLRDNIMNIITRLEQVLMPRQKIYMKNQFTKKAETVAYCEQHCPKPYDEQPAAIWVANEMNLRGQRGQMRDYNFIQSWALKKHIDYDVAYCWEWHLAR